jgi:signal transduction histidine kinase
MRRGPGPTLVAAAVIAAAIGLPCAAWYRSGTRAAAERAAAVRREPVDRAATEAAAAAERILARLEALRHSEDRRSFLDYQQDDAALPAELCEARLDSPLAQGPADPLVWAHFQIDGQGRLTLPSLDPASPPGDRAREALAAEQTILETLECSGQAALTALDEPPEAALEQRVGGAGRNWLVAVGPFHWHALELEGRPALVALRVVSLPVAALTQGFVVLAESLDPRIVPHPPAGPTAARIALDEGDWSVAVDVSASAAAAEREAQAIERRFRRSFAAGLAGALVAGGLVIGIVAQAERLARQRARFAASAAHELRTPLAGLRLYGEMLAEGTGGPQAARAHARRIAGEAERLGRVVSNLLEFSQLERGTLGVRCAAGDLAAAVAHSLERLRPTIEARGARLETRISGTLPPVSFDPDAVHQILQNLVDNAEKFGRTASDRTIHVALDPAPAGPTLTVTDRGPGLPGTLRRILGRPFAKPGSSELAGLGLGLTLVRALTRAQGAELAHAPAPGGGARFTITFPR